MKLTEEQIARVAELGGRQTVERMTLASRQSNDREDLMAKQAAERATLEAAIDAELAATAAPPATGPRIVKATG